MFLLIRVMGRPARQKTHFTFHNVSINTGFVNILDVYEYLFTFHNVSINTKFYAEGFIPVEEFFTFHNVSINTRAPHSPIIHRLFYHFLSTLSFTIILYTK